MLCTLCHFGANVADLWVCGCAETHCRHIHECPECGFQLSQIDKLDRVPGEPAGWPEDIKAWRAKMTLVTSAGSKKKPKKAKKGEEPERRTTCPHCKHVFAMGITASEKTARCPKCGKTAGDPKDVFEERCRTDPQGVIKDLIAQTARQGKLIRELNQKIEELQCATSTK